MTTLLYRGQAYVMRKPSEDQPRIQLTYRNQHYTHPVSLLELRCKSIRHWFIVAFPTPSELESSYQSPRFDGGFLFVQSLPNDA